jgi:hypothetical protein
VRLAPLLLVAFVATVASCDVSEHKTLHGHLYFAAGNYVGLFDLRDSSSSAVANLGDVTIDHMGPFVGNDLILTMRVYTNGRETSTILRYNARRNESFPLFSGIFAEYLSGANAVVFDDGSTLWATHRQRGYRDESVIDEHGHNSKPAVIRMSDTEVLYNSIANDQVLIQKYDVSADSSQPLQALSSVCDLNAAVWVADLDRLFCKTLDASSATGHYSLVTLDGSGAEAVSLPDERNFRALAHLPDQQVIILSERSNSWGGGQAKNAVWVYDLKSDQGYRIAKDQYLGNSVVYRP